MMDRKHKPMTKAEMDRMMGAQMPMKGMPPGKGAKKPAKGGKKKGK